MHNIERADRFNRASGVKIPTLEEIRSAKAAGVAYSGQWIASERRAAKSGKKASTRAANKALGAGDEEEERVAAIRRMVASIPANKKAAAPPTLAALKAKLAQLEAKAAR